MFLPVITEIKDAYISPKWNLSEVHESLDLVFDDNLQLRGLVRISPVWLTFNNPRDPAVISVYAKVIHSRQFSSEQVEKIRSQFSPLQKFVEVN
jgi:hypothetical protein